MIPLIATTGAVQAGSPRAEAEDAASKDSGFADLVQAQEDADEPPEADALPLPFPGPAPTPLDAPAPPAQGGSEAAEGQAVAAEAEGQSRPAIAVSAPVPPADDAVATPPEGAATARLVPSQQDPAIAPPAPVVRQGAAEMAMRAALRPDPPPSAAPADAADLPEASVGGLGDDTPSVVPVTDAPILGPPTAGTPAAATTQALPAQPVAPPQLHPAQVVAQTLPKAKAQDGEVEVLLAPEELGKLRFVIQHDGQSVKIVLTAERPETLEMLRRNADQLALEFRQSGYSGATIDFGRWDGNGRQGQPPQAAVVDEDLAHPPLAIAPPPQPLARATQGLDLRL